MIYDRGMNGYLAEQYHSEMYMAAPGVILITMVMTI